jgi:hypothetical protein
LEQQLHQIKELANKSIQEKEKQTQEMKIAFEKEREKLRSDIQQLNKKYLELLKRQQQSQIKNETQQQKKQTVRKYTIHYHSNIYTLFHKIQDNIKLQREGANVNLCLVCLVCLVCV